MNRKFLLVKGKNPHFSYKGKMQIPEWYPESSEFQDHQEAVIFSHFKNKELQWNYFKPKDGYFDWEKIYARPEFNIMILTEMGVGKTFGSFHYALKNGMNVLLVSNTKEIAERSIKQTMEALFKEIPEYYENWEFSDKVNVVDDEGNIRVRAYGLSSVGSIKTARDFLADIVVYDEFNQNLKYAEQKGTKANIKLQTVIERVTNKWHKIKKVFYFANHDMYNSPINTSIMQKWRIFNLTEKGEVSIIFQEFNKGSDLFVQNILIINHHMSFDEKQQMLKTWLENPEKYEQQINAYVNGDSGSIFFNEDFSEADIEHIIPVSKMDWEIGLKQYLWIDGEWYLISFLKPQLYQRFKIYIEVVDELKLNLEKYSWKKAPDNSIAEITVDDKIMFQLALEADEIAYATPYTRNSWLSNWVKN